MYKRSRERFEASLIVGVEARQTRAVEIEYPKQSAIRVEQRYHQL